MVATSVLWISIVDGPSLITFICWQTMLYLLYLLKNIACKYASMYVKKVPGSMQNVGKCVRWIQLYETGVCKYINERIL